MKLKITFLIYMKFLYRPPDYELCLSSLHVLPARLLMGIKECINKILSQRKR